MIQNSLSAGKSVSSEYDINSKIELGLYEIKGKSKLNQLTFEKLPEIKKVKIISIVQDVPNVTKFLTSSFPPALKLLYLGGGSDPLGIDQLPLLFAAIQKVLSRVTDEITLESFKISLPKFQTIVRASSRVNRLNLTFLTLESNYDEYYGTEDSEVDFGTEDYKIQYINFSSTGRYSDWASNSNRCANLVAGI